MNKNIIINTLYDTLCASSNNGVKNWVYDVRSLLDNYGFTNVWKYPGTVKLETFPLIFKQKVVDVFLQQWGNRRNLNFIFTCTKRQTYRLSNDNKPTKIQTWKKSFDVKKLMW